MFIVKIKESKKEKELKEIVNIVKSMKGTLLCGVDFVPSNGEEELSPAEVAEGPGIKVIEFIEGLYGYSWSDIIESVNQEDYKLLEELDFLGAEA